MIDLETVHLSRYGRRFCPEFGFPPSRYQTRAIAQLAGRMIGHSRPPGLTLSNKHGTREEESSRRIEL